MNIEKLIQNSEGKQLEFKRDLSSPKSVLKSLVGFANTAGGRLIVGVADDGKVLGVEHPLDEEERVCRLISDSIAPRLVPNVEMVTVENKTLLVVDVFLSGLRPHFLKSLGAENGVWVRLGSTNRRDDAALVQELQRSAGGLLERKKSIFFDHIELISLCLRRWMIGCCFLKNMPCAVLTCRIFDGKMCGVSLFPFCGKHTLLRH